MTTLWRLATCAAVLLSLAGGVQAESVEEVERKLNDSFGQLKSYTAKSETIQDMDLQGIKIDGRQEGSIQWMRKGAKVLSRVEQHGKMTRKYDDQVETAKLSTITICDGDHNYTIAEYSGTGNEAGTKTATKHNIDPAAVTDALSVLNSQKLDYKKRLLADEEIDGADCYVIEAVAKKTDELPHMSSTLWIRKSDGIVVKMVGKDDQEREIHSYVLTDIEVNKDIPADTFKFTAPEGITVTDLTAAGNSGAEGK